MDDLSEVKVGDKLFVKGSGYDKGHLEIVERITPTGRVITKHSKYDKSGRRIGDTGYFRARASKATEDDIAGIYRLGLVNKIEQFRRWDKLSAEDLKTTAELVAKYQLPGT